MGAGAFQKLATHGNRNVAACLAFSSSDLIADAQERESFESLANKTLKYPRRSCSIENSSSFRAASKTGLLLINSCSRRGGVYERNEGFENACAFNLNHGEFHLQYRARREIEQALGDATERIF